MKNKIATRFIIPAALTGLAASLHAADSPATKLLKKRSTEFREEVIKATDGVYVAIGFGVSPSSMIVGDDGVIIVDTMIDTDSAERAFAEFRKISDKPVKAILFTHDHGDHTGGAAAFVGNDRPQVWARSNFGAEGGAFESAGLTIQTERGARQAGFTLPPEKRINNGVARAYYPKRGGQVFGGGAPQRVLPTHTFSEPRKQLEIAGVKLELVAVSGETEDALYVWLPEKKVLFSGDNFYKSWPNAYAIRGTPYRDIRSWADANDRMSKEGAEILVPGHTRPIIGQAAVAAALTDYRDAIRFVFDKTIEGMNQGLTPDELVHYVKLPARLAQKDYLREYYGHVEWAVRAIFTGYLGWFDGNPTTLFSLPPAEEARRMAKLGGGEKALRDAAAKALKEGDAQWCAELCDHLLALHPADQAIRNLKADALEHLAENLLTATGRNYYLTAAQELRKLIDEPELKAAGGHVFYKAGSTEKHRRASMISEFMLTAEQTEGRYSIVREVFEPGMSSYPGHYHHRHSEVFFILSGVMEWTVNGETRKTGPGDLLYIPPHSPHAGRVVGDEAVHALMIYEPGGYERNYMKRQALTGEQRRNPELMRKLMIEADVHMVR